MVMVDATEEIEVDWDAVGGGGGGSRRWKDSLLLLPWIAYEGRCCFVEEGDEVGSRRGDGSTSVL